MEAQEQVTIVVDDENAGAAGQSAQRLIDMIHDRPGVVSVDRCKSQSDSMDIGTIVEIVFTSGATLALANGIAAWLRARRGAKITIETTDGAASIKTIVEGIDPATAQRIVERHVPARG